MSIRATAWAWTQARRVDKASDRLVLLCLADLADESGRCCRSVEALADRCGLSRSSVQRALRAIKALGLVEQRRRPNRAAVYGLRLDADVTDDASGDVTSDASGDVIDDGSGDVTHDVSHRLSVRTIRSDRTPQPPADDEARLLAAGSAFVFALDAFAASDGGSTDALVALTGGRRLDSGLADALRGYARRADATVDGLIAGLRHKARQPSAIGSPAGLLRWALGADALAEWARSASGTRRRAPYREDACDARWGELPAERTEPLRYDPDDPRFAPCLT